MGLTLFIILILIVAGLGVIAWRSFAEGDRPRGGESLMEKVADLKPVQAMRDVATEASEELHPDGARHEDRENHRSGQEDRSRSDFRTEASEELHPVPVVTRDKQPRSFRSDFGAEAAEELHPARDVIRHKQPLQDRSDVSIEASEELHPNNRLADARYADPASLSYSERLELEERIERLSIKPPVIVEQVYTAEDIQRLEEQLERNTIRAPRIFEITSISPVSSSAHQETKITAGSTSAQNAAWNSAAAPVQSLSAQLNQINQTEQNLQNAVLNDLLQMLRDTVTTLSDIQQQVTTITLLNQIGSEIQSVYTSVQQQGQQS